jgi:anionic cell wall polymer biosynthesis LytR-Cps2A-Psr (LCP) family protein
MSKIAHFFTSKNLLRILIALVLFFISISVAAAVFVYGNLQRITVHSNQPISSPTASPKPHVEGFHELEPYGLLLMGYGGGTHEGGKLTDSMMLAYIVPQKQKIFLISIPRDVWVSLPINAPDGSQSSYWKINAAYAIGSDDKGYPKKPDQYKGEAGGGELAKYAVKTVTGLQADNFATIDFSGFKKTIDVLQGVDVKVERTLDDDLYPIEGEEKNTCGRTPEDIAAISATMSASQMENQHMFPCRYEHLHFDPGVTHMDGETALKYVRSRHASNDGGDFNRATRQRNLLLAVKKRVFSLNFFPKLIPFVTSLSYDLQTDLDVSHMEEFLKYKDTLSSYQIIGIALSDKNVFNQARSQTGQDVLMPKSGLDKWDEVQSWLQNEMEKTATESGQVAPTPLLTPTATKSGKVTK